MNKSSKDVEDSNSGMGIFIVMVVIGMLVFIIQNISNPDYDDGQYCAKVEYYNPKTENFKIWKLPITIENNKLIQIQFPNGGWMDETHFNPYDISGGTYEFLKMIKDTNTK